MRLPRCARNDGVDTGSSIRVEDKLWGQEDWDDNIIDYCVSGIGSWSFRPTGPLFR